MICRGSAFCVLGLWSYVALLLVHLHLLRINECILCLLLRLRLGFGFRFSFLFVLGVVLILSITCFYLSLWNLLFPNYILYIIVNLFCIYFSYLIFFFIYNKFILKKKNSYMFFINIIVFIYCIHIRYLFLHFSNFLFPRSNFPLQLLDLIIQNKLELLQLLGLPLQIKYTPQLVLDGFVSFIYFFYFTFFVFC